MGCLSYLRIFYCIWTLRKICKNTAFPWLAFSHMKTESNTLFVYEKIRVSKNPYSGMFYAVETIRGIMLTFFETFFQSIKRYYIKNVFVIIFKIHKKISVSESSGGCRPVPLLKRHSEASDFLWSDKNTSLHNNSGRRLVKYIKES